MIKATGWSVPKNPVLRKAEAGGSQALAQLGPFSDFVGPCGKTKNTVSKQKSKPIKLKRLRIQYSANSQHCKKQEKT